MSNTLQRRLLVGIFAAATCLACSAHEFWLDAFAFRLKAGEILRIRTFVGDGFPGEARPRDPTKLERFEIVGPPGSLQVLGQDGAEPAGLVRLTAPGTYSVGYRSRPTPIVLAGPKFEMYLKDKGLDNASEARRTAGKTEADGRERFSRCAKAIVMVGNDRGAGFDHVFGFPLEVVPRSNPYASRPGDELSFLVLADGKPAHQMLVAAVNRADPKTTLSARTSEDGIASFKLDRSGFWLINTVRMLPVNEPGIECDWESLWASVTFDLADSEATSKGK
ncbi:MAG: DUF4198 domain-containing protein [Phycisphaerales bacterium]